MTTPAEIRFELERTLLSLANERGLVPLITGLHSLVMLDENRASVIYDVVPDEDGNGLYFEFERPAEVARDEIRDFSMWLAWSGRGETLH